MYPSPPQTPQTPQTPLPPQSSPITAQLPPSTTTAENPSDTKQERKQKTKHKEELTLFQQLFSPKYPSESNSNPITHPPPSTNPDYQLDYDYVPPSNHVQNNNTNYNSDNIQNNNNSNAPQNQIQQHHEINDTNDVYISNHGAWPLPPEWRIVQHSMDGRIYYFHASSGKTQWSHPNAPPVPPSSSSSSHPIYIDSNLESSNIQNNHHRPNWKQKLSKWKQRLFPSYAPNPNSDYPYPNSPSHMENHNHYNLQQQQQQQQQQQPQQFPPTNNMNMRWWKRPNSYECQACLSCILCPIPMGMCAMYHSIMVRQSWNHYDYGNALDHSRQAYQYACWGIAIFLGLFFYWYFWLREGAVGLRWKWPDWNWD